MEDRGPEHFEIELTSTAPGRRRGRERGDSAGSVPPSPPSVGRSDAVGAVRSVASSGSTDGDDGGPLRTERGRLVATGLAAGAVALFLGWALGRAGDTRTPVDDAAPASSAPVTSRRDPVTAPPDETLAPVEPATTARVTTTTLLPSWEYSIVSVAPQVAGSTDEIVAVTPAGRLFELNLATGILESLAGSRRGSSFVRPIAGDGWILVQDDSGSPSSLYRAGSTTPDSVSLGGPWESYWQVGTDLFWKVDPDFSGFGATLSEVTVDGAPTGRTIDLGRFWPSSGDPAGGVIVGDGVTGMFTVTPDGSSRLPLGQILAIAADRVVVYACDDTLESCSTRVADRATGEARPVPADPELDGLQVGSLSSFGLPTSEPMLSPDGRHALVMTFSQDGPQSGVLDLETGDFREVGEALDQPAMAWSGDGRFVYFAEFGRLRAFDVASGESFEITDAVDGVSGFTIRRPPTDPG